MNASLGRLAACLIAAGVLVAGGCRKPLAAPPTRPLISASVLAETDVLPHTQGPISRGRNYVYCATFQIAWDEFRDTLLEGDPLQLSGSPPLADTLNGARFARKNLADEDYLAIAGRVDDGVLDKIASEMQRRFPQATLPLPENPGAGGAVVYAYLFKWLPFETPFDRLDYPLRFRAQSGDVKVASFGIDADLHDSRKWSKLAKQVQVIDYRSDDDFVLRLISTSSDDQLVLAKVPRGDTLAATIEAVRARARSSETSNAETRLAKAPFAEHEILDVPVIRLDVNRTYDEVEGMNIIHRETLSGQRLVQARQAIRFALDETGVKLESSADLAKDKSKDSERRRHFIFDEPFLLMLARSSGAEAGIGEPYFAMWIETPELMQKQ